MKKVEESKNSADTSNVMYPGDVTIEYPPRINNAVNNSVVSENQKMRCHWMSINNGL